MPADTIAQDIELISKVQTRGLREAVVLTWVSALKQGGYKSVKDVPQSARAPERSLLDHVNEVNDLVLLLIGVAESHYGLSVDKETLLAASILHDVDKAFIQRQMPSGMIEYVDGYSVRDHGPAGAVLAKQCGVPDGVCELIRHHAPFNYDGHLPATAEGTILHYADLAAFDLSAIKIGMPPIHAISVMLKKNHPLLRGVAQIEAC